MVIMIICPFAGCVVEAQGVQIIWMDWIFTNNGVAK